MTEKLVSAGEAARRLGVSSVTIQRWVNRGILQAEITPGGHRRIPVSELRRIIASTHRAESISPLRDWVDVLMTGDSDRVRSALIASHRRTNSWAEVAATVASALAELGRLWEAGSCRVFEEHAASEALHRATAMCCSDMRASHGAPRAALLTIEKERHTLGLSLAELVLAEAGWLRIWIGEGPPLDELWPLVSKLKPDLLVVAASSARRSVVTALYQAELIEVAAKAETQLVLGGSASWEERPGAQRIETFMELQAFLANKWVTDPPPLSQDQRQEY